MEKLEIGRQGRLQLPSRVARELAEQPLELVSHSRRHLFLAVPGQTENVQLTGVLGEITVADLLSFLNMFRKSGVLRFGLEGGEKALYFQLGEVVFAASTFPEEDLGEILFNLGKVDRPTLEKARQFASSRTTVGKILVEKKAVSPKDLWTASRSQVEAIVFHLFTFQDGNFSFIGKELEEEQIVRLSMSTQNLIMEGLRRVDERGLFLRKIGSLEALPIPTGAEAKGLSPAEQRLLELLAGEPISVREILRKAGLAEFDGLRLLYQLLEKKLVRMEEFQAADLSGPLGEVLNIYNGALQVLFKQISARNSRFANEVRYFLHNLPQPYSFVFRDIALRGDGSVDGGKILTNLAGLDEADQLRLLADALNELLYMECLAARRDLGAEQSAGLLQRVQEIGRRVKEFTGRKR